MEPIKLKADKPEYWEKASNIDNITLLHVDLSNTADSVADMEYKLQSGGTLSTRASAINENAVYVDKPTPKVDMDVNSLPSAEQFIKDNASSICWYTMERWSAPKYRCPKCNGGAMRKDQTMVLTSNPPQYHYQCDKCGHVDYHHY